jgi:signal transduction histidine kinase
MAIYTHCYPGVCRFEVKDYLVFYTAGYLTFYGGITVPLIQTIIFLAVGFSISYLMSRLKGQQQSLEDTNIRLTHYASTLEHLATSRERHRVARELHDTLPHTLSGVSVQLEMIKAYWDVDPQTALVQHWRNPWQQPIQGWRRPVGRCRRFVPAP